MIYALGLLAALAVGVALGAAWRWAETKCWREKSREWKSLSDQFEAQAIRLARLVDPDFRLPSGSFYGLPLGPITPHLGSRPSESVRREGPTVARTLEDLMRGEP